MILKENTNLSGGISVDITDSSGTSTKDVAFINANIDSATMNLSLNISIQDSTNFTANKESVQTQINDFVTGLNAKLTALGVSYTV